MSTSYKKALLLVGLCLFLNVTIVMGQTSFSIDKLINKEWVWARDKVNFVYVNKFTKDLSVIIFTSKNGERGQSESYYYLSNERDAVFDVNKIGKSIEGRYIIRSKISSKVGKRASIQELKGSKAWCYEILKLTDDELIICDKRFREDDIPMVFKLKK